MNILWLLLSLCFQIIHLSLFDSKLLFCEEKEKTSLKDLRAATCKLVSPSEVLLKS